MSIRLLRVSSPVQIQAQDAPAELERGVASSRPSVERCEAERTEHGSDFSLAGSSGLDTLGAPSPPPPSALLLAEAGVPDVAAGLAVPPVVVLQPVRASAASVSPGRTRRRITPASPPSRCRRCGPRPRP